MPFPPKEPSRARCRAGQHATIFVSRSFRDFVASEAKKRGLSASAFIRLAVAKLVEAEKEELR
ncbi:hypothetical protein [Syntrophothermus lipocalidus]|uniref:Uncharacterized protein n=1 Tax=Syntrophothermus lipocalidus (strain DSM 12680 / TGB-C1) TaxID=643648 RepID=D7CQ08_SYNLT|nr:hypothetical protein [Syntrophothermus lipocalidus]ADI02786.1 hypothetical protein Slip_2039 [Syntrophothermus lipocalidus DSM 12680]